MKKQTPSTNELLTPEELAAHAMATADEAMSLGAEADLAAAEAAAESTDADASQSEAAPAKKSKKAKSSKSTAAAGKGAAAKTNADAPKSTMDKIREFVGSDEDEPINFNFRSILMGEGLPRFFRRNWVFISVIVFFTCSYVTCRYMMAGSVIETKNLRQTLLDRRYKALTINSELMERTLSSHIEQNLRDSTIHTPTQRAFPLVVK